MIWLKPSPGFLSQIRLAKILLLIYLFIETCADSIPQNDGYNGGCFRIYIRQRGQRYLMGEKGSDIRLLKVK